MTFRPMLSATIDEKNISTLRYPLLASPKLDGIRATVLKGVLVSRTGKAIPNKFSQWLFAKPEYEGLDGELIMGDPTAPDCFRKTSSAVMSRDEMQDIRFHVFDVVAALPYKERMRSLEFALPSTIQVVPQYEVYTIEGVQAYEESVLAQGFEGVMLRDPYAFYKFGRSTIREQFLMKLKRFMDSEALVIGTEERMHNANEATIDALGYTGRSSHKENLVGRGDLGALYVRDIKTKVEFSIGTGFDDALRAELWKTSPIGRIVKYKYFPTGSKEKPRFPVFLGFRDPGDM